MDAPEFITPAPPPLPPAATAGPRPAWGFWPTIGLGLIVMGAMIAAQSVVGIIFVVIFAVRYQGEHGTPMPPGEISGALMSDPLMVSTAVLASIPAAGFVLWAAMRLRRGPAWGDYLGLRGFSLKQFFIWTGALASVLFAGDWLISRFGDESGLKFITDLLAKRESLPLLFVALAVGAPLVEETLFRGFMYRGMSAARWAPLGAIVIPNLLWAAMHVQYRWPTILVLFLMGLVLGGARHFSRSTVLPFTLHLLSNAVSILAALAMTRSEA